MDFRKMHHAISFTIYPCTVLELLPDNLWFWEGQGDFMELSWLSSCDFFLSGNCSD